MRTLIVCSLLALFALVPSAHAANTNVKLTPEANRVRVEIGGKLFTNYWFGDDETGPYVRPYAWPVLAEDGTEVTSDQKRAKIKNPKEDHPHHRSLWVSHGDVNGVDHWALVGPNPPKQRHLKFDRVEGDTLVEELEWETKDAKPMLHETRTVRFLALPGGSRGVDITSVFKPDNGPVTFGDTKEAGLASVRMAKSISDHPTLTSSEGKGGEGTAGEKQTWGKRAAWMDISGQINGKPYGIAIFDSPDNPRHPSNWHVRAYGLNAANIFGLHDYDPKANPKGAGNLTIQPGESKTFKYRIVVHPGDAKSAGLDELYKAFAGK